MGYDDIDIILSHFLMCLNFILERKSECLLCVLLRNHTLKVVDSTIQYMEVVSTLHCQISTELHGRLSVKGVKCPLYRYMCSPSMAQTIAKASLSVCEYRHSTGDSDLPAYATTLRSCCPGVF